ncbi:VIT1/CCC1 transporter family protein [Methylacidimicrobium tartarophylax]|uniref:VIT1/CCC1 transporter family protein n=1 Tax=Methylacidimicrobium tartarophylax TaxID=1041768 RepID=UPI001FE83134|nr:VIT1/CCC1 transporter family protein [Methylacidimicrobium tartarophylax]
MLRKYWLAEKRSAEAYRDLAERDADPRRRDVFFRLAEAEERHAIRWEAELRAREIPLPRFSGGWRQRLRCWWRQAIGPSLVIRKLERAEDQQEEEYRKRREAGRLSADLSAAYSEMAAEERSHAQILQALGTASPVKSVGERILARERWHKRGGGWVADAIYGVNDGLGAVFGIVSGVASATENQTHYVLLSGLAGMLASALSMGAGAYLAAKSEREVYEAEMSREAEEISRHPEEEKEEMALFYELQGFNREEAQAMSEKLFARPDQFLAAMSRSELGLSQESFPSPTTACLSASVSTGIGALVPLLPFFFCGGFLAISISFAISILAHFLVGAAKSWITTRSWWSSGLEMTAVGVLEAIATYTLGFLFRIHA